MIKVPRTGGAASSVVSEQRSYRLTNDSRKFFIQITLSPGYSGMHSPQIIIEEMRAKWVRYEITANKIQYRRE